MALALGVTGTALLIVGPRTTADLSRASSPAWLLASPPSLTYALYVVLARPRWLAPRHCRRPAPPSRWPPLVLAPTLAADGVGRQLRSAGPWFVYLGAITSAGAYAIYAYGLRDVSASSAGVASLAEPLTAVLLGVFLFGERLGTLGILGAGLLLAALSPALGWATEEGNPPRVPLE